jgi:FKBP-type peptidyl-prolyl cis-trans isomerase FkpA
MVGELRKAIGLVCLALAACSSDGFAPIAGETPETMQERYLAWNSHRPGWAQLPSGLLYHRIGSATSGAMPTAQSIVTVTCDGRFIDDQAFFATTPGKPLTGPVTKFITGWQQGLVMMHAGETFAFVLPPALAYGAKGWPTVIAPNTALKFTITLLSVAPQSERAAP